jgi:hypothetical protein
MCLRFGLLLPLRQQQFSAMRIFLSLSLLILTLATVRAGRLDIAVVQFPAVNSVEELDAALANVDLYEITNSDRTMTKEAVLKGGTVIFVQSIGVGSGGSFSSSTRLRNQRADVKGSITSGSISLTVETIEGVKAGLRNFENRVYEGSGSISGGVPHVLSLRIAKGRRPEIVKNQTHMIEYQSTTALIAQYRP